MIDFAATIRAPIAGLLLLVWLSSPTATTTTSAEEADSEPRELVELRANYQAALEKATVPIHDRYREVLENLRDAFIAKNELDAALAVKAELELLSGKRFATAAGENEEMKGKEDGGSDGIILNPIKEKSLRGLLERKEFSWEATSADEVVLRFGPATVQVFADGKQIMEKEYTILSENELQFEWGREMNLFKISEDRRTFTRMGLAGNTIASGEIRSRSK